MTLESELKNVAAQLNAVDSTLKRVLQLAQPPTMPVPTDEELYGATQWRPMIRTAAVQPTADAAVAFLNGQWKRRDGHGVQEDLPTGGGSTKGAPVQQLDPWARRSPPAVDV